MQVGHSGTGGELRLDFEIKSRRDFSVHTPSLVRSAAEYRKLSEPIFLPSTLVSDGAKSVALVGPKWWQYMQYPTNVLAGRRWIALVQFELLLVDGDELQLGVVGPQDDRPVLQLRNVAYALTDPDRFGIQNAGLHRNAIETVTGPSTKQPTDHRPTVGRTLEPEVSSTPPTEGTQANIGA